MTQEILQRPDGDALRSQETEPKIGFKTLALCDEIPAAFLAKEMARTYKPTVMIDERSRYGRSHLRLHLDGKGYFVRGPRGTGRRYLGRCKVTFLDGEATLFQFTTKLQDAFDADQAARWDAKYGIGQNG